MTKDPMPGVSTDLMTNIKECSNKVFAPSKSITELLMGAQYVEWKHFDINKSSSGLDTIQALLNTTNATKDIGHRFIC